MGVGEVAMHAEKEAYEYLHSMAVEDVTKIRNKRSNIWQSTVGVMLTKHYWESDNQ